MFGHRFSSIIATRLVIVSVVILAVLLICSSELASGNQPPSFIELFPPPLIFLNESTEAGSTILQLKALDVDDPFVNFDLQPVNSNDYNLLTLKKTGVKSADVVLTRKLNYSVSTLHVFKFTVSDLTNKPIENRFTIYVRPASFKPPTIDNLPKTIAIAEDIPVGTQVYQVQVTDTSSVVTFELQNGSDGSFSIDEMTGIIRNKKKLDYHLQMVHLVTVVVSNRRNLNTSGNLTINITSTKNRPPYFLESFYEVKIKEGSPQGSSVYQIQAYDGNTDLTKDVSYKIVSGHQGIFTINPQTGNVMTSGVVDCFLATIQTSTSCTFNLVIEACQRPLKTAGSSCSTVLLAVSADDINSHAPVFPLPSYDCFVYKYAPPNTPIGCSQVISVIDDDLGENAKFGLSLEPANVSDWLMVQRTSNSTNLVLLIKNNSVLISESSNAIIFKVNAGEVSTAEKLSSSTNINLHLINNNNNNNNNGCVENGSGLRFTSEEYNVIVNNLPTPGVSIVTVQVTPSSSSAGDVIYNMRGSYKNIFSINDKTGDVTLTRPDLINSTKGVYAFPVTATSVSRSQGLALTIVVMQFDLQALPRAVKMTFENYVALLEENSIVFLKPVIIKAEPTNCNMNPNIFYYLTGNGEFDKNFTIDQMSGELKPKSPLDYEAMSPSYRGIITLTVGANLPGGGENDGSMATVTVILKDLNDNDPKFLQPSYNFSPIEPLKRGLLGSVAATDADATRPNNQIIYSFNSSSSSSSPPPSSSPILIDGDFTIDPITGSIYYLSSTPTSSSSSPLPTPLPTPRDQTLVVMATDLGTPPRSAAVVVTVRYVPGYVSPSSSPPSSCGMNDNVMSAEVNWSSKVDSAVLNISDSIKRLSGVGYRCHLTNTYLYDGLYRYVEKPQGSEIFTLDSDCSSVRIGISLKDNYRQVRTILSTLSVTNGSSTNQVMSGQRYDLATLIFFINPYTFALDRPTFLQRGVDILPAISSSTADDSLIAKITAVNPLELDRPMWFSISSRDPPIVQSFRINETTGALYFTKNGMDFTKEKSATLTVTATSGNPGAILSTGVASAETTVAVHFLPCTKSTFRAEWTAVGVGRRGERLDSLLVDLKEFTDNSNEETFYNISETMTTLDQATGKAISTFRTRDLLNLDERGLVTFRGLTGVLGSITKLEVKLNVSSPSCGSASSAKMLIFSIPDYGFVQIVVDQSEESIAGNYKNLTNRLAGISSIGIFPYAIYRITNDSRWSFVIVYCVDMATKELITYPQLARIFDGVNEKVMTEFKNNYKVHAIEQYSGNLTIFPPSPSSSPSSSSSSSSSCLPLVIALSVICFIFFVFIVLAVVLFLYFRRRHKKKAKEVAVSYSNAMASEYFGSNKARRDEDKDSSIATNSSTTSDFPTTTSNASSSTQNFILKKPENATPTPGGTTGQGGQGYVYDDMKDFSGPVTDISLQNAGTNLITQSSASLAASKFSDSALGSTDFSTARVPRFAPRPEDSFDEEEDRSVYYSKVKKPSVTLSPELELGNAASLKPAVDQAQAGGIKSPPSYEQFRGGSLLRIDDNNASDSFYI